MKKALFLAGLFVMLSSLALAETLQSDEAEDAGSISYRVKSSATVLEGNSDEFRPGKIISREGEKLWLEHEIEEKEAAHDCSETLEPDAMEHLR